MSDRLHNDNQLALKHIANQQLSFQSFRNSTSTFSSMQTKSLFCPQLTPHLIYFLSFLFGDLILKFLSALQYTYRSPYLNSGGDLPSFTICSLIYLLSSTVSNTTSFVWRLVRRLETIVNTLDIVIMMRLQ